MANWTFMVYLARSVYSPDITRDAEIAFGELWQIGSNDKLNIVVQFYGGQSYGTNRFFMEAGKPPRCEQAMKRGGVPGDPATLRNFAKWAKRRHPARHYALFLLSHGAGWSPPIERCDAQFQAEHNARKGLPPASAKPGGICSGCSFAEKAPWTAGLYSFNQHPIDTIQLGDILRRVKEALGQKLDLLILDSCLMSNMEVAYQIRQSVEFMVASALKSSPDWPYGAILGTLKSSDRVQPEHLAKTIVEEVARAEQTGAPFSRAALNLRKIGGVAKSLRELADNLRNPGAMMKALAHADKHVDGSVYELCDINSFCTKLLEKKNGYIEGRVQRSASKVCDALKQGDGNFMLEERHGGEGTRNFGGVTAYLPTSSKKVLPCYDLLDFAKKTGWKDMLDTLHHAA